MKFSSVAIAAIGATAAVAAPAEHSKPAASNAKSAAAISAAPSASASASATKQRTKPFALRVMAPFNGTLDGKYLETYREGAGTYYTFAGATAPNKQFVLEDGVLKNNFDLGFPMNANLAKDQKQPLFLFGASDPQKGWRLTKNGILSFEGVSNGFMVCDDVTLPYAYPNGPAVVFDDTKFKKDDKKDGEKKDGEKKDGKKKDDKKKDDKHKRTEKTGHKEGDNKPASASPSSSAAAATPLYKNCQKVFFYAVTHN